MAEEAADLAGFNASAGVRVGKAVQRTHAEQLEIRRIEQPVGANGRREYCTMYMYIT